MSEENLRKCKDCNQMKMRILIGQFDYKNKKYTDETGKLWSGSRCPQCQVDRARENMRKLRANRVK